MSISTQRAAPAFPLWLLILAVGAGALLTALIGGTVYFVARVPPAKSEPVVEKPAPPAPRDPPRRRANTKVADVRPADPKPATPEIKDSKPADPHPVAPRPTDAPARQLLLEEALGGLIAGHIYQSYLNIGLLADGWEKDLYPEEKTFYEMLDASTRMIEGVDKQLAELADPTMNPDDQKALAHSRELLGLLRTQAAELHAYWKTGDKEHADKFHKARVTAWTGIKELLKIAKD